MVEGTSLKFERFTYLGVRPIRLGPVHADKLGSQEAAAGKRASRDLEKTAITVLKLAVYEPAIGEDGFDQLAPLKYAI